MHFFTKTEKDFPKEAKTLLEEGLISDLVYIGAIDQYVNIHDNKSADLGAEIREVLALIGEDLFLIEVPSGADSLALILFCRNFSADYAGEIEIAGRKILVRIMEANSVHKVGSVVVGYGVGIFEAFVKEEE